MEVAGALIRRERLRREWSQEGLCRGICAVSYISKIEQGKAEASEEILSLLFARLGLHWAPEDSGAASRLLDGCRELLFSGESEGFRRRFAEARAQGEALRCSRRAVDYLLLAAYDEPSGFHPLDAELEPFMDARQLAMQRGLQLRFEDALLLDPEPFFRMEQGAHLYATGQYAAAVEVLGKACDAASAAGYVRIMLLCRTLMGNCYSDLGDSAGRMEAHYRAAERMAEALGDAQTLETLRYNIAATALERGRLEEAYRYFSRRESPTVMDLHKLALCCEALGRPQEASAALDAAERALAEKRDAAPPEGKMLALVRYRLEHAGYLRDNTYGEMLLDCFAELRANAPTGYLRFHLPWMLEWYKANRQYRQACELLENFP